MFQGTWSLARQNWSHMQLRGFIYHVQDSEIPTFLGFKPDDPVVFKNKQLKELKNGRLAMIAVLGELMAQQVSGYGTYEQLGLIVKSLPLPL